MRIQFLGVASLLSHVMCWLPARVSFCSLKSPHSSLCPLHLQTKGGRLKCLCGRFRFSDFSQLEELSSCKTPRKVQTQSNKLLSEEESFLLNRGMIHITEHLLS